MNFPPFWARGRSGDFFSWRWSFVSLAEAQSLATQAAQQLAERFGRDGPPPSRSGYYPNRPFREQLLREIKDDAGETFAVITRNSYGSQVLNTTRVMFVDIDLPEPKRAGGFLRSLFGKPETSPPKGPQDEALAKIENWTRLNPEWGWRIYRTRAGLRLLATQGLVEADSAAAKGVFEALGADPLYCKLCQNQKCFRARLTPKPWRCGVHRKPARWPWLDEKQEKRFQKWETEYQTKSALWATCAFVRHVGNPALHPQVQTILKIHDDSTLAESKLDLA
jgi:hypothetical protein